MLSFFPFPVGHPMSAGCIPLPPAPVNNFPLVPLVCLTQLSCNEAHPCLVNAKLVAKLLTSKDLLFICSDNRSFPVFQLNSQLLHFLVIVVYIMEVIISVIGKMVTLILVAIFSREAYHSFQKMKEPRIGISITKMFSQTRDT